ncbi:MAG: UDP-N-acetylmuramate dehydrogenase [Oceanicoccus sp.]
MLDIQENVSLQGFNTLALDVSARYFCEINNAGQIPIAFEFADHHQLPVLILGGGSNVVITSNFSGLVIKMSLSGIDVNEHGDTVLVTAGAGENWHHLVTACLHNGYYGIENLALIPGSVGAAPIQNIGAYGVELSDVLQSVSGWDRQHKKWCQLDKNQCESAYRDSVFKRQQKDNFVITAVTLKLSKQASTKNSYQALQKSLQQQSISQPTPQQIADTVISVRRSKLPDPAELANVGSFFKNPIVSVEQAEQLLSDFPDMVQYPQDDGVKLAAGWLLEQAGWKGKRIGAVGMHDQQSLVLINYDQGNGGDVIELADAIKNDILDTFGVQLTIEPTVI